MPEPHVPSLSDDILQAIGTRVTVERSHAPPINSDLAKCWQDLIQSGLSKEERAELVRDYPSAENCTFLEPPILNAEVSVAVAGSSCLRDDRLKLRQEYLVASLSGLGNVLSKLLESNDPDILPVIKMLSDSARLIIDSVREETLIRRNLILANINTSLKTVLQATTPGKFLFGDNLGESITMAKKLEQSAAELKLQKPQPARQPPKNVRAPPRRPVKTTPATKGGQYHQPRTDYYRQPQPYRPPYQPRRRSRSSRRDYPHERRNRSSYRR